MISVSMILALAFGLALIGTVVFTVRQIIQAPAGFEDENGFKAIAHTTRALSSSDLVRSNKLPAHSLSGLSEVALHR